VPPKPSELKQLLMRLEHDVRNPIGNVIGYVDLLREGDSMSSEQLDLLQRIERNCEMVIQVVERFSEAIEHLASPE
jgi:signal transduction histidine kinase